MPPITTTLDRELAMERLNKLMEIIESDANPSEAAYEYWVDLIHILASQGWTLAELTSDVIFHVNAEKNVGVQ